MILAEKCSWRLRIGLFFVLLRLKIADPIWGKLQRKLETAVPMRDGDFENQNTVSGCGTGVLKTDWDFPGAGRSDLKKKTE